MFLINNDDNDNDDDEDDDEYDEDDEDDEGDNDDDDDDYGIVDDDYDDDDRFRAALSSGECGNDKLIAKRMLYVSGQNNKDQGKALLGVRLEKPGDRESKKKKNEFKWVI
ncbi:hypothetical protein DPMN_100040 [Dreissena polymorpha]|uniref:Uncharacterized protein n=1 Tax=Dreissena polymorpha TaxID=45954 RepID=A0A9D4LGR6_DREPO|nr:hypothetical protein DPMN_100040 [Dreissena polymorpha]